MRLTKRQLKRIIREEYSRLKRRGLIREMGPEYGSGTAFAGMVTIAIDLVDDMPNFDANVFASLCDEMGGCTIKEASKDILHITGSFDALWEGWVNYVDDEPDEFMERVISGHENLPDMEY